jgi:phage terminase large subunit-like protein
MEPQIDEELYNSNLSYAEIQEKLRQTKLLKARRLQHENYRYFIPNGKAATFIQAVGNDKEFINLFIAANGVGKTATLVNILANICFQPQKWFDYPLFNQFPYIKRGRIISDTATVKRTIVPEIKRWFPEGKWEAKKDDKAYESVWETTTGFSFDIMTYEQEIKQFESATLGFSMFDEPPPQDIWKATVARHRRGGIMICGFTPLAGSAFFYDNYVTTSAAKKYL